MILYHWSTHCAVMCVGYCVEWIAESFDSSSLHCHFVPDEMRRLLIIVHDIGAVLFERIPSFFSSSIYFPCFFWAHYLSLQDFINSCFGRNVQTKRNLNIESKRKSSYFTKIFHWIVFRIHTSYTRNLYSMPSIVCRYSNHHNERKKMVHAHWIII